MQKDRLIEKEYQRRSIASDIIEALSSAIIEGKYKAGEKLPSERELQEMFQCGRGAVREALGSLQTMGLVQRFAGKGTFVSKSNVLDLRSPYVFWNEFHDISLEELVELRFALEPIAASLAAAKTNDDKKAELKIALEEMHSAIFDKLEKRVSADIRFHNIIIDASQNRLFKSIYQEIEQPLMEERRIAWLIPGRAKELMRNHEMIFNAIAKHNQEEAYFAMLYHIETFRVETGAKTNPFAYYFAKQ